MSEGAKWPYQTWGNPGSPTLLMLHGFLGSADDFAEVAASLQNDFYCVAVDLPGHGKNSAPRSGPPSLEQLADECNRFAEQTFSERPHLLGYSLGGRVALFAALKRPDLYRSLVLESASPGIQDETARAERLAADKARAEMIRTEGLPAFLESWYRLPVFDSLDKVPGLREKVIKKRSAAEPQAAIETLTALSVGAQPNLWPRLSKITIPSLIITGEQDRKFSALAEKICNALGNGTHVVLEGAGHNAHLEQPQSFAAALRANLF